MVIILSHYAVKDVSSAGMAFSISFTMIREIPNVFDSIYHAHETTATDPFAIALLCGDVRCDVS
jgi:hypothetical protein